jgi:hypothetical protein
VRGEALNLLTRFQPSPYEKVHSSWVFILGRSQLSQFPVPSSQFPAAKARRNRSSPIRRRGRSAAAIHPAVPRCVLPTVSYPKVLVCLG